FPRALLGIVILPIVFIASSSSLLAQIKSGAIVGLVSDSSGAAVADAQISVINEETQVTDKGKSGGDGEFGVPYLAPGRYTVIVEKPGFSTFKETGVALGAGQQGRVDVLLQVGSVGATVQVQAEAIALQTESTSVEGRVDSRV